MTKIEILKELHKLAAIDKLTIAETLLHLIREDFNLETQSHNTITGNKQLMVAAEVLLPDYQSDNKLRAFSVLDSEDFHAQG